MPKLMIASPLLWARLNLIPANLLDIFGPKIEMIFKVEFLAILALSINKKLAIMH
jgi:hypothetical protein